MRTASPRALALLLASASYGGLALVAAGARASGADDDAIAGSLFRRAQIDEDGGDFARALADDRAAAAAAPESRWGSAAASRAGWLEHRSEGGFEPLAQLERVRRDPVLASDPATLEALARKASSFPPGPVRSEARLVVADAWLARHRTDEALGLLRSIAEDPSADADTARIAEHRAVGALLDRGRIADAAREAAARKGLVDPPLAMRVGRLRRRWIAQWAACLSLAVLAAGAGLTLLGAARRGTLRSAGPAVRRIAPTALGVAAYVAAIGGVLASLYEGGRGTPFAALGAAVLPLLLLARLWSAVGSNAPRARVARAALCAAATVTAAFLVLERIDPTYLEGFGL